MCGVCGLVCADGSRAVDAAALDAMTDALIHRGPDEGGTWIERNAGLGARRLSVIDVAHGRQPMTNEDASFTVVFNGEIYNAPELRDELASKGRTFRTRCDTEVVLRAVEAWGDGAVERFNGMFAFAAYDTRRERLFIARDRLGIKPLVYTERGGVFAFSSELDSLLESGCVSGRIDAAALDAYLQFLYVPGPDTIFDGVRKLGPGEFLVWEKGKLAKELWWRPRYRVDPSWTLDSAAERYLELLKDSVRLRRMSDVPLGAFLSGGLDSTAVVAVLAEVSDAPVKTFTIGFDDAKADETSYARIAAARFGTDHTERVMDPDLAAMAGDVVRFFGEPFADSSAIPTWLVSKLAREQVTVALSGDGGDELFAGYTWLHMNRRVAGYRRVPAAIRKAANAVLGILPTSPGVERFRRFSGDSFLSHIESFRRRETCFDASMRAAVYAGGLAEKVAAQNVDRWREMADSGAELPPDDWMLHQDLRLYLPDDILTKVDRMSMAASLEARVPLLDHRIVEFAGTLPFDLKYNRGVSKRVVKHALRGRVPPELLRQRKRGFAIPIQRWFRGRLGDHFRDVLLEGHTYSGAFLDIEQVRRFFVAHREGRADYGHHLWALLVFEHWLRYLRRKPGVSVSL